MNLYDYIKRVLREEARPMPPLTVIVGHYSRDEAMQELNKRNIRLRPAAIIRVR